MNSVRYCELRDAKVPATRTYHIEIVKEYYVDRASSTIFHNRCEEENERDNTSEYSGVLMRVSMSCICTVSYP